MASLEQQAQSLKRAIRSAFGGITHPGDALLLCEDSIDEHEVAGFSERLLPNNWEQIPPDFIDYNYDSLPFLGPYAYRFFLPAYLCRALDSFDDPSSNVIDFVVYDLMTSEDPSLQSHFVLQKSALSGVQGRVILDFLSAIAAGYEPLSHEAREAIEIYWHRYSVA